MTERGVTYVVTHGYRARKVGVKPEIVSDSIRRGLDVQNVLYAGADMVAFYIVKDLRFML